jgi:hypothetical protein
MPIIREFKVEAKELQKIVKDLAYKYTNAITTTRESVDFQGKKTITSTYEWERLPIPVTDIDDAVEKAYPNIGDIPEAPNYTMREYTNFTTASDNVWLDASYAVEKELNRLGYKISY